MSHSIVIIGSFSPSLSMIRLLGLGNIKCLTSMRYVQSIVYPFCIVLSSLSFFVFGRYGILVWWIVLLLGWCCISQGHHRLRVWGFSCPCRNTRCLQVSSFTPQYPVPSHLQLNTVHSPVLVQCLQFIIFSSLSIHSLSDCILVSWHIRRGLGTILVSAYQYLFCRWCGVRLVWMPNRHRVMVWLSGRVLVFVCYGPQWIVQSL